MTSVKSSMFSWSVSGWAPPVWVMGSRFRTESCRIWSGFYGVFARMDQPIAFDSIDDEPVDLIFLLLAPEGAGADHLKALARVSRLLRDRSVCTKLRGCESADAIYALFGEAAASHAA